MRRTVLFFVVAVSCSQVREHRRTSLSPDRERSSIADRVAGCYVLRSGSWESDSLLNLIYSVSRIPRRIRLESTLARGWDPMQSDSLPFYGVFIDSPAGQAENSSPFRAWWQRRVGSDSLIVGVPLGFGGASLIVTPSSASLSGVIRTSTDVVSDERPSSAESPIVLNRVECSR
jgi:hypothetical protein